MKRMSLALSALFALSMVALAGCGSSPSVAPGTSSTTQSSAASSAQASASAGSATVKVGTDSIVVTGYGEAEAGRITFDQPYYIAKATLSGADFTSLLLTEKGRELPFITAARSSYLGVYQPRSKTVTLAVETQTDFTIEFSKPADVSTAEDAPQTFTGAAGKVATDLVKTEGTYVKLSVKYTGTPDPDGKTGVMLASAALCDAVTGDQMVGATYVN